VWQSIAASVPTETDNDFTKEFPAVGDGGTRPLAFCWRGGISVAGPPSEAPAT